MFGSVVKDWKKINLLSKLLEPCQIDYSHKFDGATSMEHDEVKGGQTDLSYIVHGRRPL